jgi:periplasmic divalent cation tolerance protein
VSDRFLIVFITAPSVEDAERIGGVLVEERLAACVNVLGGVRSIYRWEGAIERDDEVLMIVKTEDAAFDRLQARVLELHPYDVPEIVGLQPQHISDGYRRFLEENVGPS